MTRQGTQRRTMQNRTETRRNSTRQNKDRIQDRTRFNRWSWEIIIIIIIVIYSAIIQKSSKFDDK